MKDHYTFEDVRNTIIDILTYFTRIVDEVSDSNIVIPKITGNTAQEILDQRIKILDTLHPHFIHGYKQLIFNLHGTFVQYIIAISESSDWFRKHFKIDDTLLDEISEPLDIMITHYKQTKPLPDIMPFTSVHDYTGLIQRLMQETRWYFEQNELLVTLILHALTSELTRRQECAIKLDENETVKLEAGLKKSLIGALGDIGINIS